jgi:hypothetical protein
LNPIVKTKPINEQTPETLMPIIPPEESEEPELLDIAVADGAPVVAPPFMLLVWLGNSLLAVAEVGELTPVVVAATCQTR